MYPAKYIIIPDTNILWKKEKDIVVNEDFSNFWDEYSTAYNLELAIPYVVKGELLFQQSTTAQNHLEKITSNIVELNKIIHKSRSFRLTDKKVRKYVEARFDKWLKSLKGSVIETPISDIDLNEIIEFSIWRKPPFKLLEKDSKDKDRLDDGGFRDSMILEAVVNFVLNSNGASVAFLSNDNTLRNAAEDRIGDLANFSLHESIDGFISYAKLLHENLEKKFVSQILSKARSKFYSRGDDRCVWHKFSIYNVISDKFSGKLKPSGESDSPLLGLLSFGSEASPEWNPYQDYTWIIVGTNFGERKGEREYHWNTIVRYRRIFYREEKTSNSLSVGHSTTENYLAGALLRGSSEGKVRVEKELTSEFNVKWKADVSPAKRFSKIEFLDIEYIDSILAPYMKKSSDED